ncbi:MAG: GAF domain-containing protein, partial [Candidatus Promineifilaceae bacterium]|nr:GAF domain-containing protein [Candidatus Promineifilaceae bacterium]
MNQQQASIESPMVETTIERPYADPVQPSSELDVLVRASLALASAGDQVTIMKTAAVALRDLANARLCTISAPGSETHILAEAGADHAEQQDGLLGEPPPHDEEAASIALRERRPVWNDEMNTLVVPLTRQSEAVALAELQLEPGQAPPSSKLLQALVALGQQAALALDHVKLSEDTFEREMFFAALGRVTLAINAPVNLPAVLDLICQESLSLFAVEGASIWQLQDNELVVLAARGRGADRALGGAAKVDDPSSLPAAVVREAQGLWVNDFRSHQELAQALPHEPGAGAALGVPLRVENEILGVLMVVDARTANRFGRRDLELATLFAVQAATAIRNSQLVSDLQRLNEQLDDRVAQRTKALGQQRDRVQYLLRVTTELSSSLDQHRVLFRALQLINEVVQATHGTILLVDAESGRLVNPPAYDTHMLPPMPTVDLGPDSEAGLAGWIVDNRQTVIVADTRQDERWQPPSVEPELRSALGLPLISGEEVIGVLLLFHTTPNAFFKEQLELVEAAAQQIANAISNAQLFLLIRDQAQRLGQMLREEHVEAAKSQAILESIADGVLVADADGHIILTNLAASLILDMERAELEGRSLNEFLGLYGASGRDWLKTIAYWKSSDETQELRPFLADRLQFEDKIVSVRLSPVYAREQFFGTVSIFRDVTKEAEVDRMKSEFVSTVSHELRTPMTSIKGYAELLLLGAAGKLAPTQTRYLQVIQDNADRMTALVNDLLDISRIESGRGDLELVALDVRTVIDQVTKGHLADRIKHEGKDIHIWRQIPSSLPLVEADPTRLTQIMVNLVDNAFQYTPGGGQIGIRVVLQDRYV